MVRQKKPIDLNPNKLSYYSSIISMNRCNGSCNTDLFDRIQFHVKVDVNLMVENVTREKNGTMTSVNVSVQNQSNILYAKDAMSGIIVHLLVSVIRIVALVNN